LQQQDSFNPLGCRRRGFELQDQPEWSEASDDPRVERDSIHGIKPNSGHQFGNTRQILLLKVYPHSPPALNSPQDRQICFCGLTELSGVTGEDFFSQVVFDFRSIA
jgi:hypothetical protein